MRVGERVRYIETQKEKEREREHVWVWILCVLERECDRKNRRKKRERRNVREERAYVSVCVCERESRVGREKTEDQNMCWGHRLLEASIQEKQVLFVGDICNVY